MPRHPITKITKEEFEAIRKHVLDGWSVDLSIVKAGLKSYRVHKVTRDLPEYQELKKMYQHIKLSRLRR